ncbi:hypothetical protein [Synechococcus phage DSL-LC02]|nr:hypothetical protein [Synechococcus phage DSL-LC02]
MTYTISNQNLAFMIRTLETAVDVCYRAPESESEGEGYPYATGYSKSAMQMVIDELKGLTKD